MDRFDRPRWDSPQRAQRSTEDVKVPTLCLRKKSGDKGGAPLRVRGGLQAYLRIRGNGGARVGGGLGGSTAERSTLASLRGTGPSAALRAGCSRPHTDIGGKADGYYLADGTDSGGGRDLELGEHGEGGARGDHARHRYADRVR